MSTSTIRCLLLLAVSCICEQAAGQESFLTAPPSSLTAPTSNSSSTSQSLAVFRRLEEDQNYFKLCNESTSSAREPEYRSPSWTDELTFLAAVDGSKQPQDFGVNATVGGQLSMNWGMPILEEYGIGAQVGTGVTASNNAVRVYELLGETKRRNQSFTTAGLFQRLDNGFSWGFVHDFLYEDYYDRFSIGQWRMRTSYLWSETNEFGTTTNLRSYSDSGTFGASTPVRLNSINQGSLYWRHFWQTGAQTTAWAGVADRHGENNAVTGPSPEVKHPLLFGADVLMPLSPSFAIYGETNMIMPSDTGTVDAFLGLQWYPGRRAAMARRGRYSPIMPLASPTSLPVDLKQ